MNFERLSQYKILFMGSPYTAQVALEKLIDSSANIVGLVCQPDKELGRGRKIVTLPIKEYALSKGIKVYQPIKVKGNVDFIEEIHSLNVDFIIVSAYGQILPDDFIKLPKYDILNIHYSLLPKYRGASPVNQAILNGDSETGVSIMRIVKKLDAGDVFYSKGVEVAQKNAVELMSELAILGAEMIVTVLADYEKFLANKIEQDEAETTYAPMINKEDGLIDWESSAELISRKVRGLQPWPNAYTYLDGKQMILYKVEIIDDADVAGFDKSTECGTILIDKDKFFVKCKVGALKILELQLEGRKRLSTKEFLMGYKATVTKFSASI